MIWDIKKKKKLIISEKAIDQGLAWSPDGSKLLFVDLVDDKTASKQITRKFGTLFKNWKQIPAIFILDVEKNVKYFIHIGATPVFSTSGKSILSQDFERNIVKIDIDNKNATNVSIPGAWGRYSGGGTVFALGGGGPVFALIYDNFVLYWGLPTKGSEIKRSPYGSFRAGLQMIPIKVAQINTDRFQTVLPHIDPRHSASFGYVR